MTDTRYHDLLTLPVDTLVNPVNCKGAMGKGLALQFKHRFPGMNQAYRNACRNQSLRPGRRVIMITPSRKRRVIMITRSKTVPTPTKPFEEP